MRWLGHCVRRGYSRVAARFQDGDLLGHGAHVEGIASCRVTGRVVAIGIAVCDESNRIESGPEVREALH
jgi:hypothetical protein